MKSNLLLPATNSSTLSQQISPNALYASDEYPALNQKYKKLSNHCDLYINILLFDYLTFFVLKDYNNRLRVLLNV